MEELLKIHELTGGYSKKNVLHGISFNVNKAQIVGLIGLNVAGKSTTIKQVIGLMQPKQGSISIKRELSTEDITAYRKQFGYIPEPPILYDELTLYEHLRLTAMAYDIDE